MAIRGIFQKTCPSCATPVPVDDPRCACGYSFHIGVHAEEASAEDDLLREYVKARLTQATETLEGLHAALQADPKNFDKANQLMKAYAEVRSLRAELKTLSTPIDPTDLLGATAKALAATQNETDVPQAFRALQAHKAEKVMHAAGMKTKECGKCHAILPERAVLCFCGYAFSPADAAPENDADAPETLGAPP